MKERRQVNGRFKRYGDGVKDRDGWMHVAMVVTFEL